MLFLTLKSNILIASADEPAETPAETPNARQELVFVSAFELELCVNYTRALLGLSYTSSDGTQRKLFQEDEQELLQQTVSYLIKLNYNFIDTYRLKAGKNVSKDHLTRFGDILYENFVAYRLSGMTPVNSFIMGQKLVGAYVGCILSGFTPAEKEIQNQLTMDGQFDEHKRFSLNIVQNHFDKVNLVIQNFFRLQLDIQYNYELTHREEDLEPSAYEGEVCPLCLEQFKPGQIVFKCTNNHIAHGQKITDPDSGETICDGAREWVCNSGNSCPSCRSSGTSSLHRLAE